MQKNQITKIMSTIFKNFLIYLLLIYFSFSLIRSFYSLNLINVNLLIIFSLILLIVNIFVVILIRKNKTIKEKINRKSPQIISIMLIIAAILNSIQSKIIITESQAEKVISIQWIIFAITIALFIFWNTIIPKYIENITPTLNSNTKEKEKLEFIKKIDIFTAYTNNIFFSATYLLINSIILLFVTAFLYLKLFTYSAFIQSIIMFSFYLTFNSFLIFMTDISLPIHLKKCEIENESNIVKNRLKLEMISEKVSESINMTLEMLNKIEMDEGERQKLIIVTEKIKADYEKIKTDYEKELQNNKINIEITEKES